MISRPANCQKPIWPNKVDSGRTEFSSSILPIFWPYNSCSSPTYDTHMDTQRLLFFLSVLLKLIWLSPAHTFQISLQDKVVCGHLPIDRDLVELKSLSFKEEGRIRVSIGIPLDLHRGKNLFFVFGAIRQSLGLSIAQSKCGIFLFCLLPSERTWRFASAKCVCEYKFPEAFHVPVSSRRRSWKSNRQSW